MGQTETIAVIGLGYVGLPVAVAFARKFRRTIGFDTSEDRVAALRAGVDATGEVTPEALGGTDLVLTADPADLEAASFYVVAVPTPIDAMNRPDLSPLMTACEMIGPALRRGNIVVFESTVYPGLTEEKCGPALSQASGLVAGVDFKLGYSPERINPGDTAHTLERITKIVAASDAASLDRVAAAYGEIIEAGLHRAPSIKVAEAAKVIENTQRDLNIALMNELAIIFGKLEISTRDVLAAAQTKWNFLPFSPGLVGGHCIGVDPYYLTSKAEAVGYHPDVILAGRRINDSMGRHVARELVKLLVTTDRSPKQAKVGILGITFKENVPDVRNTRVVDIVAELREFGVEPLVHDPLAPPEVARDELGLSLSPWERLTSLDALVLAVPHRYYVQQPIADLLARLDRNGVVMDVKSVLERAEVPPNITYWSL